MRRRRWRGCAASPSAASPTAGAAEGASGQGRIAMEQVTPPCTAGRRHRCPRSCHRRAVQADPRGRADPALLEAVHPHRRAQPLRRRLRPPADGRARTLRPGHGIEFEMLAGMAPQRPWSTRRPGRCACTCRSSIPALRRGRLLSGAPPRGERLLGELPRRLDLDSSEELSRQGGGALLRALDLALTEDAPATHRLQDRTAEEGHRLELGTPALPALPGAFRSTPDTDLSTAANQEWAARITCRIRSSELREQEVRAARRETTAQVEETVRAALAAQRLGGDAGREARPGAAPGRRDPPRTGPSCWRSWRRRPGRPSSRGTRRSARRSTSALFYAEQAERLAAQQDSPSPHDR